MMAEAPALPLPVITMPPRGKKGKVKQVTNTAMVLNSLTSTLPIVMPEVAAHLEGSVDSVRSAPNSPERGHEGPRKKKGIRKYLSSRPKSPNRQPNRTFHSDPESASPSPQSRPSWLPFKNKRKKSPAVDLNNGESSVQDPDPATSSGSSFEPEATSVEELPGRTHFNYSSNVPEIRVSSECHDQSTPPESNSVTFEEISGSLDPYRKNSQSSRCSSGSGLVSVGTSGIGSCLSPSGDESYPGSDLESPLSPCSRTSSFTEDTTGDISDPDPIEKDLDKDSEKESEMQDLFPSRKSPSFSHGSNDNLSVTTPTPTSESPPTLVSPTSPEDKELKLKRKRDKFNKVSGSGQCGVGGCAVLDSRPWPM